MAIMVHHPLHLLRLRFPMQFRVKVWTGMAYLRNHGASKKLRSGESVVVPAFLRFDCDVMPLQNCAAIFSLAAEPVPVYSHQTTIDSSEWSRSLAYDIFMAPQISWTAARLASQWQVTLPKARARLFAEGEALHSLVREQRLSHALHMVARMDGLGSHDIETVALHSGFASMSAFADACAELTGVKADILLRGYVVSVQ